LYNIIGDTPKLGKNDIQQKFDFSSVYLFEEKCTVNDAECSEGLDRYGLCCYIYDNNDKIIKSRYSDFPW
jgi:hypothetical protein